METAQLLFIFGLLCVNMAAALGFAKGSEHEDISFDD